MVAISQPSSLAITNINAHGERCHAPVASRHEGNHHQAETAQEQRHIALDTVIMCWLRLMMVNDGDGR